MSSGQGGSGFTLFGLLQSLGTGSSKDDLEDDPKGALARLKATPSRDSSSDAASETSVDFSEIGSPSAHEVDPFQDEDTGDWHADEHDEAATPMDHASAGADIERLRVAGEEDEATSGLPPEREAAAAMMGPQDDEQRLAALAAEFGAWPVQDGEEPERFIVDGPCAVMRGVLIRGRFFVTNYRLLFYAILPSSIASDSAFGDRTASSVRVDVIRSGAVTVHREGVFARKHKRWLVLRPDSLSLYRESGMSHMHKPSAHLPLTSIIDVDDKPSDEQSLVFWWWRTKLDGKRVKTKATATFEKTEQAVNWRRDLAKAVWTVQNTRDRFRASVPYVRIKSHDVSDFLGWTQLFTLAVNVSEDNDSKGETRELQLLVRPQSPAAERFAGALSIDPPSCAKPPMPVIDIFEADQSADKSNPADGPERTSTGQVDADHATEASKSDKLCAELNVKMHLVGDQACRHAWHADLSHGIMPTRGTLGISRLFVFFQGSKTSVDMLSTRLLIALTDIKDVQPTHSLRFHVHSLRMSVRAADDYTFDLHSRSKRDHCLKILRAAIDNAHKQASDETAEIHPVSSSLIGRSSLDGAKDDTSTDSLKGGQSSALDAWIEPDVNRPSPVLPPEIVAAMPRPVNLRTGLLKFARRKFALLTIGSRGDVQPFIALGQRLKAVGQDVVIITHPEYKDFVTRFGIDHRPAGGDPTLLMEISVEHKIFDKGTQNKFRSWLDDLFNDAYKATEGCDVLIEAPSAFAGIHIAESRKIPYLRAFTMSWTQTTAFPHPFLSGATEMSTAYNALSYTLFSEVIWRAMSGQVNRFRKRIGLEKTTRDALHEDRVPFVYNFSMAVVPRPFDWPDNVIASGYWFLEPGSDNEFEPPQELKDFIAKAKSDGKPLVYIGFGSITVPDPSAVTAAVVQAVQESDVRAILAKGWSGRLSKDEDKTEIPKDSIYQVDSIAHDWLFPQCDIAVHHGGAGTVAASLRFGLTTLVKPFFGDQTFWASRVTKIGAGFRVPSLKADDLTEALKKAVADTTMRERAQRVGELIRAEDGVATAIEFVFSFLKTAAEERGASISEAGTAK